ncbi:WD40 repeat-like protein, partial [Rickenella mellea]
MKHLQKVTAPLDPKFQRKLVFFLKKQVLYWLEVLSVLKEVNTAPGVLSLILQQKMSEDIENFVKDAMKFVSAFGGAITQSVSHIYLSALPFAPKISVLAQHYLPQFSKNMLIQTGKEAEWPVLQHVLEGHIDHIRSVAFSPDSKHIVSGSNDKTIRVWDAETGTVTLGPLEGHTEGISSVAFSPNGKHIVSGSDDETIRVWDAETGIVTLGPLEGHTSYITTVTFSPDGKHIVSGSYDKTIRVWDAETGTVILGPLEGHTDWITSVAFSPDG